MLEMKYVAAENMKTGAIVYLDMSDLKMKNMTRPEDVHVAGIAARNIRKGEKINFNPSDDTGDIVHKYKLSEENNDKQTRPRQNRLD